MFLAIFYFEQGGTKMSVTSQESNMRRLAVLSGRDSIAFFEVQESNHRYATTTFVNLGKDFLRALAKDLGLRAVTITIPSVSAAASGDCALIGMWENCGIYVSLQQPVRMKDPVLCYHTVRHAKDFKGGYNRYVTGWDLQKMPYAQLLDILSALRKGDAFHDRAA